MVALNDITVPISGLLLDPNNYRFQDESAYVPAAESRFREESVQTKALARLRLEGLSELKNSILHNGFLPFERIVVREFGSSGEYLVVEGNRRVAALKWIANDHEAGVEVSPDLVRVLSAVPVVVISDLDDDPSLPLSLMGIRHVGGVRQWGGYQRAKLVTELRDDFSLDTSEVAARLGMTAHEVNRRYRAYKALQQMMSDDEYADVSEPDMYPLFHEAVSGTVVKEWLGWSNENLVFEVEDNLHQFYALITPHFDEDGSGSRPAKIDTYQSVRDLREILPVSEARRRLLDPEYSFSDALAIAKAEDLARTWIAQAAEAVASLKSVGAIELKRMPESDLSVIRELQDIASELIETHGLLAASVSSA